MTDTERLLDIANNIVANLFGQIKTRRTRGPDDCLRLYTVSWKGPTGNEHKLFKHKKNAYDFYNAMKTAYNGQAGIKRVPYDCHFIAEEGIDEMYADYDIQDWSLEEFRKYVEARKDY